MKIVTVVAVLVGVSCQSNETKTSSRSGASSNQVPGTGSLAIDLTSAEEADGQETKNALIAAVGRPDVTGTSNSSGRVVATNILPGSLQILVTSQPATGLASSAAEYGIKIDDVEVRPGEIKDLGNRKMLRTGSIKAVVKFYENPNNFDLAGTEVFIPGTSWIGKSDNSGNVSLQGIPPGQYEFYAQRSGFSTIKLSQVIVAEGSATDLGTLLLSLALGPEGSIAIQQDQRATINSESVKLALSRTISLNFKYDSDAALMKIADEPSFINKQWVPVKKNASWTFTSDGKKSIYVMYADLNGLESSPYSDSIYVDTEAPTLSTAKILYGWAVTAGTSNFVDLAASDGGSGLADVQVSYTDASFSDNVSATSMPANGRVNITLGSAAGLKTVYFKVRDFAGRTSNVVSDTITKGDYTEVFAKTYSEVIELRKDQSPFKFIGDFNFTGDVLIEPGSVLVLFYRPMTNIEYTNVLFKAKVTANGTSALPITITSANEENGNAIANPAACHPNNLINFGAGAPGASEGNTFNRLSIKGGGLIKFGGGLISDSDFVQSCPGMDNRSIFKVGPDLLRVENSRWGSVSQAWFSASASDAYAFAVDAGDGATRFAGNTIYSTYGFYQATTAKNSLLTNNLFYLTASSPQSAVVSENALTITDNTFEYTTSPGTTYYLNHDDGTMQISGNTHTNCKSIYSFNNGSSLGPVTMSDETVDCEYVFHSLNGDALLDQSNVEVSHALVAESLTGSMGRIHNSTISLAANLADLARLHPFSAALFMSLKSNSIACAAATTCRAGIVIEGGVPANAGDTNINLCSNTGLSFPATPAFSTCADNFIHCDNTANATFNGGPNPRIYEFNGAPHSGTPSAHWAVATSGCP